MQHYYAHGKLLLTAEYLVLLGAEALALPCRYGQTLSVETTTTNILEWKSYTIKKECWFEAQFALNDLKCLQTTKPEFSDRLQGLLINIRNHHPRFLSQGTLATTHLEFDRLWGLGSSSTLVATLAAWAKVDPYELLKNSFGGSGYDLACASANGPICYQIKDSIPSLKPVIFDPPFKENLYFIYQNQKQNSQNEVNAFLKKTISPNRIQEVNTITRSLLKCRSQKEFNRLLLDHELLLSDLLGRECIQKKYFADYEGQLKSLGAWGGDFILAAGGESTPDYFKAKGFSSVIRYEDMVL